MKIALLGASGRVGSRLLAEMLRRGHEVTGIARHVDGVPARAHLALRAADAGDADQIVPQMRGHDVVASALRFAGTDAQALIAAVKRAGVPRLMVVGGAGTLEGASGVPIMDAPGFPDAYRAEAVGGRNFLDALRAEQALDWTFLSPSAEFIPDQRTGQFRLGNDQLLVGSDGKSWISMEDFAIAFADEMEAPRHSRRRFTVGY